MIAANIDVAFVIQACEFDFNVRRLERYLVMVREGQIEPVLLLTKIDLVSADELGALISRIRSAGIDARIFTVSNVTGAGLDEVRGFLSPGRTYCLLGSSGIGKTTLINRLAGDSALETQDVSHTGEGRHTTTRRQLIVLEGGALLIDMPGMRELGMLGMGEGLDDTFADVGEHAQHCRFSDCTHSREPGCAVREAIERGTTERGTPAGLPEAAEGVRIPRLVVRGATQEGPGIRPVRAFRHEAQGENNVTAFRVILVLLWLVLAGYTGIVIAHHGTGLFAVFFGDMAAMGWPGQFNLDFMSLLLLSALWVAWRHRFSGSGMALGVLAFFGGALFLTGYLLILSIRAGGSMTEVLLGKQRATSR